VKKSTLCIILDPFSKVYNAASSDVSKEICFDELSKE